MLLFLNLVRSKGFATSLLLLFAAKFASGQTAVKVTFFNQTEQNYLIDSSGKIWFDSNNLIINTTNVAAQTTIPIADIRKITFDGDSTTTGINKVTANNEAISILPNPASNYFKIESSGGKNLDVRIYNTSGAQVASGTYASGNQVDISYLTTGIYVVVINKQSFKLIKQ